MAERKDPDFVPGAGVLAAIDVLGLDPDLESDLATTARHEAAGVASQVTGHQRAAKAGHLEAVVAGPGDHRRTARTDAQLSGHHKD